MLPISRYLSAPPAAVLSWLLLLLAVGLCGSCTDVEFERSPYAPRGVDIVYSQQEDTTFLVWRVDVVVDFERVHFELNQGDRFEAIDLANAPFPSPPFRCNRLYWCLQFQIDGQWTPPAGEAPLRAVDSKLGSFDASPARLHETQTSFSIDPVGIENNRRARPELSDWFSEQKIPLQRDFEWALVDADGVDAPCPSDSIDAWSALAQRVDLPQQWMDNTPCMAVRPVRADRPGDEVRQPLVEGAVLYAEDVDRLLPAVEHPLSVAFLIDLEVINPGRCNQIVDAITDQVYETLDEKDVTYEPLGQFVPADPGGDQGSGCDQQNGARYPVQQIAVAADEAAASFDKPSALLLVYLNNLSLPPSAAKTDDLAAILAPREADTNPQIFRWAIGSGGVNDFGFWDDVTPWAPIEDDNFMPSLESSITYHFPLKSTEFDGDDALPLYRPNRADNPHHLRLCSFSPWPDSIAIPPAPPLPATETTWPWPDSGQPELYFDIPPQRFVADAEFRETTIVGVYEVCDDFCERPFEGNRRQLRSSWLATTGECHW